MFNPQMVERLAEQHHAERLREAEISRLPVAEGQAPGVLKPTLVLALILAVLLVAQVIVL